MDVHLVDGTYELFRHFYAMPRVADRSGREAGATGGVVTSMLGLLEGGATHVAVATDHVIESFRNDMWPDYKDGSGIDPDLRSQFEPVEDALRALGVVVWPMVEHEADDGLAAGAAMAAADERVQRVYVCSPDKDLAQCVDGTRVVQLDRRQRVVRDETGIIAKFGVRPVSIPDYLALVGDSADGFPGLEGWGAKSAAAVLGAHGHLEEIPRDVGDWAVAVRGASRLAGTLARDRELALLFRQLATLDHRAPVSDSVEALCWTGPATDFAAVCEDLRAPGLATRAEKLAAARAA